MVWLNVTQHDLELFKWFDPYRHPNVNWWRRSVQKSDYTKLNLHVIGIRWYKTFVTIIGVISLQGVVWFVTLLKQWASIGLPASSYRHFGLPITWATVTDNLTLHVRCWFRASLEHREPVVWMLQARFTISAMHPVSSLCSIRTDRMYLSNLGWLRTLPHCIFAAMSFPHVPVLTILYILFGRWIGFQGFVGQCIYQPLH